METKSNDGLENSAKTQILNRASLVVSGAKGSSRTEVQEKLDERVVKIVASALFSSR